MAVSPAMLALMTLSADAQLNIAAIGPTYSIDFDNTVAGVNEGTYLGTGFEPSPASGQLDSDAWSTTGMSDGSTAFGGSYTTGDHARGVATLQIPNGNGGFYAMSSGSILPGSALGFQPAAADMNPGTIVLRIQNNTGNLITSLQVAYEIHNRNDYNSAMNLDFAHGTVAGGPYTPMPALDFDGPSIGVGGGAFTQSDRSTTLNGLSIPNGGIYHLVWSASFLSGDINSMDELAIDDISITASTCMIGGPCSDGNPCTTGEAFDSNCACTGGTIGADTDGDGFADVCDNCPSTANADQADNDFDGVGNVCDNCPDLVNGWASTTHKRVGGASVCSLAEADDAMTNGVVVGSGTVAVVNYADAANVGVFGGDMVPLGIPASEDNFAVRSTGYLHVTVGGNYVFRTNTDDGTRLRLDLDQSGTFGPGEDLIVDGTLHPQLTILSPTIVLSVGYYRIEHMWFECGGGAAGELSVSLNGGGYLLFGDKTGAGASAFTSYGVEVANSSTFPDAAFSGLPATTCTVNAPYTLSPITPGGTFSGPGVSGSSFDPQLAGPGTVAVTHTLAFAGCPSTSVTQTVSVGATPDPGFTGLPSSACSTDAAVTLVPVVNGGMFTGSGVTGTTFDPSLAAAGVQSICRTISSTVFEEDFSDNSAGWTLGTEWAIGPAVVSSCAISCPGNDPSQDHTPTSDNGLAGMVIGGCTSTGLHAYYYLTSPVIDVSGVAGSLYLEFWRHLHADYPPYMAHQVEVYNGSNWISIWTQPSNGACINDASWTQQNFNVTAYKNASFRVRFGQTIGAGGAFASGSWSIDDLKLSMNPGGAVCIGTICQTVTVNPLQLSARALLDGPYKTATGLMSDSLRTLGLVPLVNPYGGVLFGHIGTEATTLPVLAVTGSNAIVDWVLLELRSDASPTTIVAQRAALLQRDGDIVDVDGTSPVTFIGVADGTYHVAVRHRNHLGTMTASGVSMACGAPASVDFTLPALGTYGTDARKPVGSVMVLWAGNSRVDDRLRYTNVNNDRDFQLVFLVAYYTSPPPLTPTSVAVGFYATEDANMDGTVKYTGSQNDRDLILLNVNFGFPNSSPTRQRIEQLP